MAFQVGAQLQEFVRRHLPVHQCVGCEQAGGAGGGAGAQAAGDRQVAEPAGGEAVRRFALCPAERGEGGGNHQGFNASASGRWPSGVQDDFGRERQRQTQAIEAGPQIGGCRGHTDTNGGQRGFPPGIAIAAAV